MTRKFGLIKAIRTAVVITMIVQLVLGSVSIAEAATTVIFRTRIGQTLGSMPIHFNRRVDLGLLNVSAFNRIRVCANSNGSVSGVRVTLLIIQDNQEIGALEPIVLTRNTSQTKVFDVPGVMLKVIVEAQPPATGVYCSE